LAEGLLELLLLLHHVQLPGKLEAGLHGLPVERLLVDLLTRKGIAEDLHRVLGHLNVDRLVVARAWHFGLRQPRRPGPRPPPSEAVQRPGACRARLARGRGRARAAQAGGKSQHRAGEQDGGRQCQHHAVARQHLDTDAM